MPCKNDTKTNAQPSPTHMKHNIAKVPASFEPYHYVGCNNLEYQSNLSDTSYLNEVTEKSLATPQHQQPSERPISTKPAQKPNKYMCNDLAFGSSDTYESTQKPNQKKCNDLLFEPSDSDESTKPAQKPTQKMCNNLFGSSDSDESDWKTSIGAAVKPKLTSYNEPSR